MASLVVTGSTSDDRVFELKQGSNFVGRARGNDIVLEDLSVSNRHCEIVVAAASVRVRDLGSTNGTYVGGSPVTEREVQEGEALRLGVLSARIHVATVEVAIPSLPAPEAVGPAFLPNGAPACEEHRTVAATFQCTQCGRMICDDCLHVIGMVGGPKRRLCPACSGFCERLVARPTGLGRLAPWAVVNSLRNIARRFSGRQPPPTHAPRPATKFYSRL